MPEKPWITQIAISCDNEALRSHWREVEDQLRMIVARCGWDTRGVTLKLKEVIGALDRIRATTLDMNLPPSKRFKNARANRA